MPNFISTSLSIVSFSGIAALLTGGMESGIMYLGSIALISLSCFYVSIKKKNDAVNIIK